MSANQIALPAPQLELPPTRSIELVRLFPDAEYVNPSLLLTEACDWNKYHHDLAAVLDVSPEELICRIFQYDGEVRDDLSPEEEEEVTLGDQGVLDAFANNEDLYGIDSVRVGNRTRTACRWANIDVAPVVHKSEAHRKVVKITPWAYKSAMSYWHRTEYAPDIGRAVLRPVSAHRIL